jgi:hypothetical protein
MSSVPLDERWRSDWSAVKTRVGSLHPETTASVSAAASHPNSSRSDRERGDVGDGLEDFELAAGEGLRTRAPGPQEPQLLLVLTQRGRRRFSPAVAQDGEEVGALDAGRPRDPAPDARELELRPGADDDDRRLRPDQLGCRLCDEAERGRQVAGGGEHASHPAQGLGLVERAPQKRLLLLQLPLETCSARGHPNVLDEISTIAPLRLRRESIA